MAKVSGTNIPQTNRTRYSFTKQNGWSKEITVEGLKSYVLYKAQRFSQFADSVTYETDGPIARLTATVNGDTTAPVQGANASPTIWEIIGQSTQRHVTENPKIHQGVSSRDIANIKEHRDKIIAGDVTQATVLAQSSAATAAGVRFESTNTYGTGTTLGIQRRILLYKFLTNQEHTISSEYVLRKNQTVKNEYELEMATAGVDKVWTSAKVFANEDVPMQVIKTMSGALLSAYTQDGDTADILNGTGAQWNFGFLKQAPQITFVAGGQVERSQEWWLNYWLSTDYPLY
jgi:hypothetical protein